MKESNKAALISAFIYPGVGHFYLKKKISGCVLVVVATYSLFIIADNIMTRAMDIADKIISGQVAPDVTVIRQLISQPQSEAVAQQLSLATTALIIVWIIGIIDSYRLGSAKDVSDKNNVEKNGKLTKDGESRKIQ